MENFVYSALGSVRHRARTLCLCDQPKKVQLLEGWKAKAKAKPPAVPDTVHRLRDFAPELQSHCPRALQGLAKLLVTVQNCTVQKKRQRPV